MSGTRGKVYLVGAGPGDPELITVRGLRLLRRADVVLYDRLAPAKLLSKVKPGATLAPVGKQPGGGVPQSRINDLLIEHARAGRIVVRLKGGDPFVFGRGFEELAACRDAGIECEVVPGVSSAIAGPMSAGVPVTHRGEAQSMAIVTAAGAAGEQVAHDFAALARLDTVVVMMGRGALRQFCASLQSAGRDGGTAAACIERATASHQRVVTGTLETIADQADRAELVAPMVTVIGATARHADNLPLAGLRVWLTRPRSSAVAMRRSLQAAGAAVIEAPLIRIAYAEHAERSQELTGAMCEYDWVMLTSVHGARALGRWLRRTQPGDRFQAKVAAVGPATADALKKIGLSIQLMPEVYTGSALAEALLALEPRPRRVLYPRSSIASGALVERLRGSGMMVDDVVAYRTVEVDACDEQLAAARDADVVVLCSPSAARAYARLLSREGNPRPSARTVEQANRRAGERTSVGGAKRRPSAEICGKGFPQGRVRESILAPADSRTSTHVVCCIGPVTANAAKTCGLDVQVVADRSTSEGVVAALVRCYAAGDSHSRERIPARVAARRDSRTSES